MDTDYGRKITKNTFFVSTAYVFGVAVSFIITPYVIHKLGMVRFGVLALINTFFAYYGLLDLGINFSFIKFISQYYSKKEYRTINHLLSTGVCFNIVFGLLIFIIVVLTRNLFLHVFRIEEGLMDEISRTLFITGALYFIHAPFRIFSSLIDGLQRFEISRTISITTTVISTISTVVALKLGYKLDGLVLVNGITYFFTIFLTVLMSKTIYPGMKINLLRFDKGIFRELFSFGFNVQISQLARIIHFEADKLIIGIFLSPVFVGFYEAGAKINRVLKMVPTFTLFAVLPASSEMHAAGKHKQLFSLYSYGSKFMALINIFLSIVIFVLAPQIIYLWLGQGFEMSVVVVRMLIFAYSVNVMISAFGMEIARGMGKVVYERRASLYQAILNILLSTLLTYLYGFRGALLGTVISSLFGAFYFLYIFHRDIVPYNLKLLFNNFYKKPLYKGALLGIFIFIANKYILSNFGNLNRINMAWYVLTVNVISFFAFSLMILQSGYFSRMELSRILDSVSPWVRINIKIIKSLYGKNDE